MSLKQSLCMGMSSACSSCKSPSSEISYRSVPLDSCTVGVPEEGGVLGVLGVVLSFVCLPRGSPSQGTKELLKFVVRLTISLANVFNNNSMPISQTSCVSKLFVRKAYDGTLNGAAPCAT